MWGVETLKGNKIGLKMDLQGITASARRERPRDAASFDELLIATDEQLISR